MNHDQALRARFFEASIGAVALAYNNLEFSADQLMCIGLLGEHYPPLAKRINGMDGKLELIKLGPIRA